MGVTVALILGASFLAAQFAQATPLTHAEGVISRVESTGVTVKGSDSEVRLQINRATTIFVKGRTGSAEDLKVGDSIRGAYDRGGAAQWIEVVE